jgi:hypothetical protein
MKPSEVRRRVLDDHGTLRALLGGLEATARQVLAGESDLLESLRLQAEALLERLDRHMHWEDVHLRPALLESDAWGEARACRLDEDHREQREVLAYALASVADGRRPASVVARGLLDLVELLRADMDEEEQLLVSRRVLRDDVVAIDPEDG